MEKKGRQVRGGKYEIDRTKEGGNRKENRGDMQGRKRKIIDKEKKKQNIRNW